MSQPAGTLIHPVNKDRVQILKGFSWPCFFFGCFWYVAKGLWGMGILAFLLALVTWGISWLVFPFFANDQYRKSLLKDGYLPDDQIGHSPLKMDGSVADEIRKLAELKASGVLTDEEFSTRKSRLLGA
jgi:hypothetical protein